MAKYGKPKWVLTIGIQQVNKMLELINIAVALGLCTTFTSGLGKLYVERAARARVVSRNTS